MAAIAVVAVAGFVPATAPAAILPAKVLDGPSASILDVDGSAMAPDGSGGIVYRKLVGGVAHVFVDQFVHGAWQPPVQADAGQQGPAAMPAIAAADNGELLVVWVQPWAAVQTAAGEAPQVTDRLMSALLQPGASRFGEVEPVDAVGSGVGVDPSLTMSPSGSAYVTYRVVTNTLAPDSAQPAGTPLPMDPGDELVDVRVAKFDGAWWSGLGAVNAYPGVVTDRPPTASNAPQVATVSNSSAVVVWQEPDPSGYARIWARYIFGSTLGNPIQLSPSTANGKPVDVDADAPSVGLLGNAAFRLLGGAGSPYGKPQEFGVSIPTKGGSGSAAADALDIGAASSAGTPNVGADILGEYLVGAPQNGQATLITPSSQATTTSLGSVGGQGPVLALPDPAGGWAAAWPATNGGLPTVQVSEQYPGNETQTGSLSAPLSGPISGLSIGNSDLGDGLLGWMQGPTDKQQVMGAVLEAPPQTFQYESGSNTPPKEVQGTLGWVRPAQAKLHWYPAIDPLGPVTYEITVDGQTRTLGLAGPTDLSPVVSLTSAGATAGAAEARLITHTLPNPGLGTGKHVVNLYAVDQVGQKTLLGSVKLSVDASAPTVHVAYLDGRRAVRVNITDAGSGVAVGHTRISFGDHTKTISGKVTATHRYARAGRYTLVLGTQDHVGNKNQLRVAVRIR